MQIAIIILILIIIKYIIEIKKNKEKISIYYLKQI